MHINVDNILLLLLIIPLHSWYNNIAEFIILVGPNDCQQQEEYSNNCDSSDVIIDPQEFLSIINKALLLNNRACQKELLKG